MSMLDKIKTLMFYGQKVTVISDDLWETEIKKPIYGSCIALNAKLINEAIMARVKLRVICPTAIETFDPQEFKNTAQRIEKVFRIPTQPMILYQKTIGKPKIEERGKELQIGLDFGLNLGVVDSVIKTW